MKKVIKSTRLKVQIAKGNTKIGKIPTISLPPCKACRADAPCRKDCYALKAWRQYSETRAAWTRNYKLATENRHSYFYQINSYLFRNKPKFFRWHTSGDILDQRYLELMIITAQDNPSTNFLCFTKMYMLDFGRVPSNLTIIFSAWPSFPMPETDLPKAFMLDDSNPDARIPADVRHCPGHCDNCGMCWALRRGESVVFHKH